MNKKYQVFVSSTFKDLEEERAKVIETLLNKDCIPVGMEYFPAADDEQMAIIKQLIDDCDYYVLILGGKYGSVEEKSGKSFTQLEYEYAIEKKVPVSAFYFENKGNLPSSKVEMEPELLKKLTNFENMAKGKMCKAWFSSDDLAGKVSTSLDYQIKNHPRCGWIKADRIASDEANSTILRLQEENEKLKRQIDFLSSSSPIGTEQYKQENETFEIHYYNPFSIGFAEVAEEDYSVIKKTWNEIFLVVCTLLLKPVSEKEIKKQIEERLFSNCEISISDFQTILIQLMALKLINADIAKDYGVYTYWVLTSYGKEKMVKLKAIKK